MNLHHLVRRWRQRQKITLTDLTAVPLHFLTHSPVERYRVAQYGDEREALQAFLGQIRPDDVVFDIGASVGLYAIAAATKLPQGRLVAFEPDPETRAALQKNVALNQLTNVQFVPWAVSDRAGSVTLYSDGVAGRAPTLAQQTRRHAPQGKITVPTQTLDEAIARSELPLPTVLKIDIEGAELLCLRGCQRLLAGEFGPRPRVIMLELHPLFLPDFGGTAVETRTLLETIGYAPIWQQLRDDQEHLCYTVIGNQ